MKLINQYKKFVGLKIEKPIEKPDDRKPINYESSGNLVLAQRHLDYLKETHNYQKERESTIESKNSQIVGQASIIISICALFIPLVIDNLVDQSIFIILPIIFCFITILFHYVLAIIHSTKPLDISKYPYATRSTNTVTKSNRKTSEQDFLDEEINDLVFIIDKNTTQNNKKGSNLIYATRSFRIASISFAILALLIIGLSFTFHSRPQIVEIKSVNTEIYKEFKQQIVDELSLINSQTELNEIKSP